MTSMFPESNIKKASPSFEASKKEKMVKVKFNFSLSSPKYDSSIALKKAKEEKSYIGYELQTTIDFNTVDNFYLAGKIYDVSEEYYNKFATKIVETYNPIFGSFQGKAIDFIQRLKVPYMLRLDENEVYLNPMEEKLDLYPKL